MAKTPVKRPRMIDIARRANVSRTAVTHVLTGAGAGKIGGVSKAKSKEIRRVAEELGYVPNAVAQQLAGKRSGLICLLASEWRGTQSQFFSALVEACPAHNFEVLAVQASNREETLVDIVESCLGRGVDGLVFLAFVNETFWPVAAPVLARFPRVLSVMGDPGIEGGCCAACDYALGMRLAVEHLHAKGRQKIVAILEHSDTAMNRLRQRAFLETLSALGRPAMPEQLYLGTQGWTAEDAPKFDALCADLLDRGADAILADSDWTALCLLKALARRGVRVPDDLAVMGWGDELPARWSNPSLSSVSFEFKDMANTVTGMLADWIEGCPPGHRGTVNVPMKLISRESA